MLVVVVVVVVVVVLIGATLVTAIDVDQCGALRTSNTVYTLTSDLVSNGSCLAMLCNNCTLMLQGHTIEFDAADIVGVGSLRKTK